MAAMTLYDIALAPPIKENACSPNPWKSRYALNFKKVPYKTTWVPLPDVSSVRGALNIPASRNFADGSPYHTLPVLIDPATDRIVGDSFEIAKYLQDQYPASGDGDLFPENDLNFTFGRDLALFAPVAEIKGPEGHVADYVKFNTNVDSVFSAHAQLMLEGFPFDPATAQQSKAEFARRAGVPSWEVLGVNKEQRGELLKSFEETLGPLAKLFERDASGPFLMGSKVCYADIIVGGWLRWCRGMLPRDEWEALKGWHGGVFGRLHEALKDYAQID